jgi:hypothetical protein
MIRVTTRPDPAEMVDLATIWHLSHPVGIGILMRQPIPTEQPVAISATWTGVDPAAIPLDPKP